MLTASRPKGAIMAARIQQGIAQSNSHASHTEGKEGMAQDRLQWLYAHQRFLCWRNFPHLLCWLAGSFVMNKWHKVAREVGSKYLKQFYFQQ